MKRVLRPRKTKGQKIHQKRVRIRRKSPMTQKAQMNRKVLGNQKGLKHQNARLIRQKRKMVLRMIQTIQSQKIQRRRKIPSFRKNRQWHQFERELERSNHLLLAKFPNRQSLHHFREQAPHLHSPLPLQLYQFERERRSAVI